MCGKDKAKVSARASASGSPPHVRERRPKTEVQTKDYRITPACAGKTYCASYSHVDFEDHPRMCGKDKARASSKMTVTGSPPHVRERHR